jgi:hypothetical protein
LKREACVPGRRDVLGIIADNQQAGPYSSDHVWRHRNAAVADFVREYAQTVRFFGRRPIDISAGGWSRLGQRDISPVAWCARVSLAPLGFWRVDGWSHGWEILNHDTDGNASTGGSYSTTVETVWRDPTSDPSRIGRAADLNVTVRASTCQDALECQKLCARNAQH